MSQDDEIEMVKPVEKDLIINDFTITFSTINGSGSATSNTTLLRALFKMGIPVSGKNIFPSNIKGMPTWYTIRLSKKGYLARVEEDDIVVAMNPTTFQKELDHVVPGGVLFYADNIAYSNERTDIYAYPMPVKRLVKESGAPAKLRDYIANMVYVGVVAQILGIDLNEIESALDYHFKGKRSAIDLNFNVIKAAANWAEENLVKKDPYRVAPMSATQGCIMTDGNTAGALGSIYGGVQFVGWYPITPATSLAETMTEYLPLLRKDPETGKNTFAIIQSEDELASIGMAIGAGWAGLRSMTSTSGPGLSLMTEYLGLAYYAEIPVVVWDVQRVGPSTGMPTRTAQGDLTFAYFMGHGDSQNIILIPNSVKECFEFGWRAFDIAERIQTPVIVMSDLDLGMNEWMSEPFEYPDVPMDRGKILWEEDLEKMIEESGGKWGRYLDVDGDGIPYRTLPGNRSQQAAYFTRGTGHDDFANYSEEGDVWEKGLDRLKKKYQTARDYVPSPIVENQSNAKIGIIVSGSADFAVQEARDTLKESGLETDYLRIRAVPFCRDVEAFIQSHDCCYVVEINRDGQLKQLLIQDYPDLATRLIQLSHIDGLPLTARWIKENILRMEESRHD